MSRRDEVLKEMGLSPVWRLRSVSEVTDEVQEKIPDQENDNVAQMDWSQLKAKVAGCTDCKLRAGCTQTVFGVGDEKADWLLVGEAPGAEEDRLGEPFVGQAGRLLDNMLAAIELKRGANVYIANVLKCRPPGNRNPEPDEIATCEPFLFGQLASIQPKVVIALGAFAARTLLKTDQPISRLRGRVFDYRGASLIPTFHPSFLLRSPGYKREAWDDLKKALALLGRDLPGAAAAPPTSE